MTKIRFKTGTPQEVRRTLSRVVNMVANKEMDSKTANAITVCCNAILASIRVDEQQKYIEELAELLEEVAKLHEENQEDDKRSKENDFRRSNRFLCTK